MQLDYRHDSRLRRPITRQVRVSRRSFLFRRPSLLLGEKSNDEGIRLVVEFLIFLRSVSTIERLGPPIILNQF